MKSYKIDEDEDKELIEPAENDDMGMADLLKKYLKRKINNIKDEELYIDSRFIFRSAARAERLFSHCKYIKIVTRNRLTTHFFNATTFLQSNRELWKKLQQLISRAYQGLK